MKFKKKENNLKAHFSSDFGKVPNMCPFLEPVHEVLEKKIFIGPIRAQHSLIAS